MKPPVFDKIKLFRGSEIQPARPPADDDNGNGRLGRLKRIARGPWLFMAVTVIVIALFLSYLPTRSLAPVELGEIAPADIVAPFDLVIEDAEETARRKEAAAEAVLPVYFYDANVFANTEDKIRRMFEAGRAWIAEHPSNPRPEELKASLLETLSLDIELDDLAALIRLRFPAELEETLVLTTGKIFRQGIVLSKNLFIHGEPERGLALRDIQGRERIVKVPDLLDIGESERSFAQEIERIEMPARNRALLRNLSQVFLTTNVTYNKIETDKRRELAREGVGPVTFTVKKGRVIVRKGDEVTAETLKIVDAYRQRLRRRSTWLPGFAGTVILYLFLFVSLWYYLNSVFKGDLAEKKYRMTGSFLVGSLILYKLFLTLAATITASVNANGFSRIETYHFALPFQVGALMFAFLASDQMTLIFIILNSLTVGHLLGGDFFLTIFCFVGGLAAVYGVKYFRRRLRASTLRAGFIVLPVVNTLILLSAHLIESRGGTGQFAAEALMGLVGAATSAALAFLLLPLVESAFGFVTSSKLLELTNSDLPVFRQMSLEAPGSYHHSLVVATLAEKAAEELGLNAQLAKAGALYHDIGKLKMPEYFIENRSREFDLHKDLKPSMSTLVIKNHVKEGVEMARKLRLPKPIRDIIEQHHGHALVRYFYNKAKQTNDLGQKAVGEEAYRYQGPRPKTKEAGLVMMADSVEAASRSLKAPTKDNLRRVITDIINAYLQDGQLDESDFSLRELRVAAASFLAILYAIYHPRIEYPGFSFEDRKGAPPAPNKKPERTDDRDPQPPKEKPDPDA